MKFTQRKTGLPAAFWRFRSPLNARRIVVAGFHPLLGQRAGVLDRLLADLAEARIDGRIVHVRRLAIQNAAWSVVREEIREILGIRVVRQFRLLRCVQMIERAMELVEAVDGGQVFVAVAQVVLPELPGGVTLSLEQLCDGHVAGCRPCEAPGIPILVLPVRKSHWPVINDERPAVSSAPRKHP